MKKQLLLLVLFLCSFTAFSQYNFYKLNATVNAGGTQYFGDLNTPQTSYAGSLNLDFNISPFASIGVEVQKGELSAGVDEHTRMFRNSFTGGNLNAKLYLGAIMDFESSNFLYAIRNLYLGTGVGMINNTQTQIARTALRKDGTTYTFPGVDKGSSLYIPVNMGYRINITDRWGFNRYNVNFNYQFNTALKDNLDGYEDPAFMGNQFKDFYGVFSIGVGVSFGPEGLY